MASGYILTEAEKEERIRYAASHNVEEFADMFGLAVGTAKVFYCRHGISARYKLEQRWNSIDKGKFCKYAASHTLNQIACHFHVARDRARTLCKKFEIEPKSKLLLKDISTEVSRNHRNTATAHTMIKYLAGKFSYGSIGKVFGYSKERVRQICEADGKGKIMTNCEFCKELDFLKSIQKKHVEDGSLIDYRYTSAIVDEVIVNGKTRGKSTHYTWLPINFCPSCGNKL